ncbi:hypothetical protein [Bradyrhizobium sp.]|jgi:adenylylsulfate kinase-like enzyme|uniref:hypothetical protein n=1 Tax=Bradyrhizobium sp. TaxID=376 RepID=UPI002DDCE005|nr:hypothetical protein [Bradyrhizobium sp.]HEV2159461.1 hypothetical protein [Bradyrhizobium sp.]
MNGNLRELREELRQHFSCIAATFDRANTLIFEVEELDGQTLREQLRKVDEEAEQGRARALTAQASFDRWMNQERLVTIEQIAGWKQQRQTGHLHARADRWSRCAIAAVEIAVLAMDQAERTILYALLAREEAMAAQITRLRPDHS